MSLGVVSVSRKDDFSVEDIEKLATICDIGSVAIKNKQLALLMSQTSEKNTKLVEITKMVSSCTNIDEMVELVFDKLGDLVPHAAAFLFTVDRKERVLVPVGKTASTCYCKELRIGECIAGRVAQSQTSLMVHDKYSGNGALDHPKITIEKELEETLNVKITSVLTVPIKSRRGVCTAVLQLFNVDSNQDTIKSVEAVAASASAAIESALMFDHLQSNQRKTDSLLKIFKVVSEEREFSSMLEGIVNEVYCACNADRVAFFVVDSVRRELVCLVSKDISGMRVGMSSGVVGYVAQTGKVLNVGDANKDPRFNSSVDKETGYQTSTLLCVPVCDSSGKVQGVLEVINKQRMDRSSDVVAAPRPAPFVPFDHGDEVLLDACCREIGRALDDQSTELLLLHAKADSVVSSLVAGYTRQRARSFDCVRQMPRKSMPALFKPEDQDKVASSLIGAHGRPRSFSCDGNDLCKIEKQTDSVTRAASLRRPSSMHNIITRAALTKGSSWEFEPWTWEPEMLLEFVEQVFEEHKILEPARLSRTMLRRFVMVVRDSYHKENPFHCWEHALSIFQFCHMFFRAEPTVSKSFTWIEKFSLFVAALCHDIDHPGLSNDFLMNTGHELALIYNDQAILENHHTSTAFRVMSSESTAIMANFSKEDRTYARKIIINSIMATDMKKHFDLIGDMRSITVPLDLQGCDQRMQVLRWILHTADLNAQAMPWKIAYHWCNDLIEEFHLQSIREKESGVPQTPHMQNLDDPVAALHMQINFLQYVIVPMWEAFGNLFPSLSILVDNLHNNIKKYQNLKVEHEKKQEQQQQDKSV
eukprot:TRINITY_DN114_c0_g1_i2.p1 TRINITY_DN114_c0_g1~~TRINITY_DN114_c0_g1_i2.p1  ORF type:complete len:946 (-),score=238.84 TRINITY_DN114_c0_g1_i2:223-2667(-)